MVEPFGSPALDQATARLTAYLISPHLSKDAPRPRVVDFIPDRVTALTDYLANRDAPDVEPEV